MNNRENGAADYKLLAVDDDSNILFILESALQDRFGVVTASTGAEALRLLDEKGPFAVIVSDLDMGAMSGIDFLHEARLRSPDTVRLIMTGNADLHTAIALVNEANVFRFLTKPVTLKVLQKAAGDALQQYRLAMAERDVLERTLSGAVKVLTEILMTIDPGTFERAMALKNNIRTLAPALKQTNIWELEMAAMLSRIGYATLPTSVVNKARSKTPLPPAEQELITRIPQIGHDLLCHIPRFEEVSRIVLYQAKNFDGSGFPNDELAFEAIPSGARILRLLTDLGDLLWRGTTIKAAFLTLRKREGAYDPAIMEAAERCFSDAEDPSNTNFSSPFHVRDLRAGLHVLSDIETNDGALLLPADNVLSASILEKIKNFHRLGGIREPIIVRGVHQLQ